jgi:integrase/recombinase XerD
MLQLRNSDGEKKYLTPEEREKYLIQAAKQPRQVSTFCLALAHTGCRISEALELTVNRIDMDRNRIVFETLKKRRKGDFREVPVPPRFIEDLDKVHGIREMQAKKGRGKRDRLWQWSRTTGWRYVKSVMEDAGIARDLLSPKALRHGFAVYALTRDVPLNKVSEWLGHSELETTAIYTKVSGKEEDALAARLWE